MLEVAKMNPFGSPFVTAKCQAQDDVQGLVRGRTIAAASAEPLGGEYSLPFNYHFCFEKQTKIDRVQHYPIKKSIFFSD